LQNVKSRNEKPSHQKAESANFQRKNSRRPRNLFKKTRKGKLPKKLAFKWKKLELNSTNLKLKSKKTHSDCAKKPDAFSTGTTAKKKKHKNIGVD
jgi:hypothetical protein